MVDQVGLIGHNGAGKSSLLRVLGHVDGEADVPFDYDAAEALSGTRHERLPPGPFRRRISI